MPRRIKFQSYRLIYAQLRSGVQVLIYLVNGRLLVRTEKADPAFPIRKAAHNWQKFFDEFVAFFRVYQWARLGMMKGDLCKFLDIAKIFETHSLEIFCGEHGPVKRHLHSGEMHHEDLCVRTTVNGGHFYHLVGIVGKVFPMTYKSQHFGEHLGCPCLNFCILYIRLTKGGKLLFGAIQFFGLQLIQTEERETSNSMQARCLLQCAAVFEDGFRTMSSKAPSATALTTSHISVSLSGREHRKDVSRDLRVSEVTWRVWRRRVGQSQVSVADPGSRNVAVPNVFKYIFDQRILQGLNLCFGVGHFCGGRLSRTRSEWCTRYISLLRGGRYARVGDIECGSGCWYFLVFRRPMGFSQSPWFPRLSVSFLFSLLCLLALLC